MSRKSQSDRAADSSSGTATSAKIMNTQVSGYVDNPRRIYLQLKCYIDAAANYNAPRTKNDVDPVLIKSRTIQLAVPEFTSPAQELQLFRAIRYGKKRGVSLVITKIRG